MSEEALWKSALKAMMNVHFALYLLSVICVGFGAGNIFAFLFWHLQVDLKIVDFCSEKKFCRTSAVNRFCSACHRFLITWRKLLPSFILSR